MSSGERRPAGRAASRPLVRLGGAPGLESELEAVVRKRLRERQKAEPGLAEAWRDAIARRAPALTKLEAVRFLVWHRQFAGPGAPGIPRAIAAARWLLRRARAIRSRA